MERQAECEEKHTADEFPEQHGGAVFSGFRGNLDVQDGEHGVEGRREQAQQDADPVADIQAEDQQHTRDGEETDEDFFPVNPCASE